MTDANSARYDQPGWRGTDRAGGTWVLTLGRFDPRRPWSKTDRTGEHSWRSQEEAEAAGLVPLVAASAQLDQWRQDVLAAAEVCAIDEPGPHIVETGGYRLRISREDYSAPLYPGNPEHLRLVAEFLAALAVILDWEHPNDMKITPLWLRDRADRLDREQREAEQEAAEALEFAEKMSFWGALNANGRSALVSALVEFRAGCAERQEVGQ